jgi:prophage regulatory protein
MRKIIEWDVVKPAIGNTSKVTVWRWEKKGEFPQRVNLSPSKVGWYEDEISEWIDTRPKGICQREIRVIA